MKSDEKSFDNTGEENHTGAETRAKIRRAEIQAAAFAVSFEQPDTTTPEVNKQLTGSKDNGKFMQEKIYWSNKKLSIQQKLFRRMIPMTL